MLEKATDEELKAIGLTRDFKVKCKSMNKHDDVGYLVLDYYEHKLKKLRSKSNEN